jgi:hypothetical protein
MRRRQYVHIPVHLLPSTKNRGSSTPRQIFAHFLVLLLCTRMWEARFKASYLRFKPEDWSLWWIIDSIQWVTLIQVNVNVVIKVVKTKIFYINSGAIITNNCELAVMASYTFNSLCHHTYYSLEWTKEQNSSVPIIQFQRFLPNYLIPFQSLIHDERGWCLLLNWIFLYSLTQLFK